MITEKQRQARNTFIGASECAAIMGMDPWRSAWDLWALKTEKHEETGEAEESEAQRIGNLIEPTTASLAEHRLGVRLVKPTGTYKAANGVMAANLDRQLVEARRGAPNCELKSTGIVDGWGEEGTDEVPERTLIQVTAQMICSDARVSHVARLLGRFGLSFSMYVVEFNPKLAEIIEGQVCEFWREYVEKDIPPDKSIPSIGVVSHLRRTPGKVIDLGADIITKFTAARDARKLAESNEETAKAQLLAALGDAEGAKAPGWSVSFRAVNSKRLDTGLLKAEKPDIYAAFEKPSSYRRLDVRESKS